MTKEKALQLLELVKDPDRKGRQNETVRAFIPFIRDEGDLRGTDLGEATGWTDAVYVGIPDEGSEPTVFVALTTDGRIEMANRNLSCHEPMPRRKTLDTVANPQDIARDYLTIPELLGLLTLYVQDAEDYTIGKLTEVERTKLNALLNARAEDDIESYLDGVTEYVDACYPEDEDEDND